MDALHGNLGCSCPRSSIPYIAGVVALTFLVVGILAMIDYGPFASFAYSGLVSAIGMSIAGFIILILVSYYANKRSEKTQETHPSNLSYLDLVKQVLGLKTIISSLHVDTTFLDQSYHQLLENDAPETGSTLIHCKDGFILTLQTLEQKSEQVEIFRIYGNTSTLVVTQKCDELTYYHDLSSIDKENPPNVMVVLKGLLENGTYQTEEIEYRIIDKKPHNFF